MKSFVIASVLFVLLVGIIVGNAIYVHHVSNHILEQLEVLSLESSADELSSLEEYWTRHRPFVSLSLGYGELDHLTESLLSMKAAHKTRNVSDFERFREICRDAARELTRLERFSPENLF